MSSLGFEINRSDLPADNSGFDPIPAGNYTAKIADAELRDSKSGTGRYIKLRFDITGPSYEGRVVFTNLNIQNQNPKAEEIGQQQLNKLMLACGLDRVTDTDQFLGCDVGIKVSVRTSEEYGDQNEVKNFMAIKGSSAPKPAAAAPATSSTPPWAK